VIAWIGVAAAATGCSLADPDADVRRFFPEVVAYSVNFVTFQDQDPEAWSELGRRIGGLDRLYETIDVPYTLYTVWGTDAVLGYVWGTNQRGRYSNLQVVAVTDPELELQEVYLQKIRSPQWEALSAPAFLGSLDACWQDQECRLSDPTGGEDREDFEAILRAMKKLWGLSELLLVPGRPPAWTEDSVAEWIANLRLHALVREVVDGPSYVPPVAAYLPLEAPVAAVSVDGTLRVFPLALLQRTPVVIDGDVVVSWSSTTGTVSALRGPEMIPTQDVLFRARVVRDAESGTVWSPELAMGLYGERAGQRLERLGVGVTTWADARQRWPAAQVAVGPSDAVTLDLHDAVVSLPGQGGWRWAELPEELLAGGVRIERTPVGALAFQDDRLVPLLLLPETTWRALFPNDPLGTR